MVAATISSASPAFSTVSTTASTKRGLGGIVVNDRSKSSPSYDHRDDESTSSSTNSESYNDFLAYLYNDTPPPPPTPKKSTQRKSKSSVRNGNDEKRSPPPVFDKPVKDPVITGGTSFSAAPVADARRSKYDKETSASGPQQHTKKRELSTWNIPSEEDDAWSSDDDNDDDDDISVMSERFIAIMAGGIVPSTSVTTTASPYSQSQMSKSERAPRSKSVSYAKNTSSSDRGPPRSKSIATRAPTPAKSKSFATRSYETDPNIPTYAKSASTATLHFTLEKIHKEQEMEGMRAQIKNRDHIEPVPIDYFTKLGQMEMETKALEQAALAEQHMPIAIKKMTAKAEEDRVALELELRTLSEANMSEATRHFKEIEDAKKAVASAAAAENGGIDCMPAAIQRFTMADYEAKAKKYADIEEIRTNPPSMPAAQEFFTNRANEERERKAVELKALRENPPPASVATEYFNAKEAGRKLEIEAMMNEPAPAAIEYFTQKAVHEKSQREMSIKKINENPPPASVATAYFARMESKELEDMAAMRSQVSSRDPIEPLPIDYFTKLGEEEQAAAAKELRELSESQMPIAVKKMTSKAAEDKAAREQLRRELSELNMSVATRYFKVLAETKDAKSVSSTSQLQQTEMMPAAIQRFTMAAREESMRKQAAVNELRENPPPMPAGQDYFTMKDRAEKERKATELQALRENPPPASVATEYFNKKEAGRMLEIEAMMNEPAPAAIEYFTNKAKEEKSRRDLMLKEMNETPPEPAVATKYFAEMEAKKAAEIEATRAQIKSKKSVEPLPINYFTKLGQQEMEERALSKKLVAENSMPVAVKKMTRADEFAKSSRSLNIDVMPIATKYFYNYELEQDKLKAAASDNEPVEIMPAAIQHFTLAAHEESIKKKKALEEMRENPPPMAPGVAHFTPALE